MKFERWGIVFEIYLSKSKYLRERRRRAALVLEKCNHSAGVIERIRAMRSLGIKVFPELRYHNEETNADIISLKLAKDWVEEAFLNGGAGDIA